MRRNNGNKFLVISAAVMWGLVVSSGYLVGNIGLDAGQLLGPAAVIIVFGLPNFCPL